MKKILIYNVTQDKEKQLTAYCSSIKAGVRKIAPGLVGQKVGFLAGVAGMKKTDLAYKGPSPEKEVLIFVDFSDSDLDEFLQGYREAGIEPIALKAVLTQDNCQWTFIELYRELNQEHMAYEAARQAVNNTM